MDSEELCTSILSIIERIVIQKHWVEIMKTGFIEHVIYKLRSQNMMGFGCKQMSSTLIGDSGSSNL